MTLVNVTVIVSQPETVALTTTVYNCLKQSQYQIVLFVWDISLRALIMCSNNLDTVLNRLILPVISYHTQCERSILLVF